MINFTDVEHLNLCVIQTVIVAWRTSVVTVYGLQIWHYWSGRAYWTYLFPLLAQVVRILTARTRTLTVRKWRCVYRIQLQGVQSLVTILLQMYQTLNVILFVVEWRYINLKLVTGDFGHPVTNLLYVNGIKCLSDICWTYTVISHTVLWQGYYMSTHLVS